MRKLKNEELNRLSIDDFHAAPKLNACLILDDIRSMHNVGSVFRTADAFRVSKIWLCGITGRPPHREIHKTALGATETVEWEHSPDIHALITRLQAEKWTIVSLEQADESIPLDAFGPSPDRHYAFILGNEVYGVKDPVVSCSDQVVEIPQFGTKHSLNISVSCGILLWDYLRKVQPAF